MSKEPILRCKGQYRGKECGKFLGRSPVGNGIVEIKCPRCGEYNIFQIGGFKPIEVPREIGQ